MPLGAMAFMMSTTFYAVFVATTLLPPPLYQLKDGLAFVGILASVSMLTQCLLDYPTGGFGDWIGQRWILATSFLFFATAMVLTALVRVIPFVSLFMLFVLIYVLQAFGGAFQSGAIAAWFDTNYRAVAKDPERKAYSVAQGRMGMLFQIFATATLIPGAILAIFIQREGVFLFQAFLCVVLAIGSLILFRDYPEVVENRPHRSLRNYYSLLKDGLKFTVSSRYVFFFIIGTVLMTSTITVWGNMLLWLIYYSYLYDDLAVAIFRTVLFAFGVLWIERAGVWTRGFSTSKWIPRSRLFQTCGPVFYFIIAAIIFIFPATTIIVPFPLMYLQLSTILICVGFIISGIATAFSNILNQRLFLDFVPDRIRNGIYSLLPTLTLLLAVPQALFFAPILFTINEVPVLIGLGLISLVGLLLLTFGIRAAPVPEETTAEPPISVPPEDII